MNLRRKLPEPTGERRVRLGYVSGVMDCLHGVDIAKICPLCDLETYEYLGISNPDQIVIFLDEYKES